MQSICDCTVGFPLVKAKIAVVVSQCALSQGRIGSWEFREHSQTASPFQAESASVQEFLFFTFLCSTLNDLLLRQLAGRSAAANAVSVYISIYRLGQTDTLLI